MPKEIPPITGEMREIARLVRKADSAKGGRAWWESLTDEQRAERIRKMVDSRKRKAEPAP